ncbi:hypothetical protein G5V57_31785 [Nordella sp. HKS 07]|nr:hypothetical protein G5V57_31785 [Nordella sp. HKS 07]
MNVIRLPALACIGLAAIVFAVAPASALTTKECGVKYQAAKEAGTLKGLNWNEFRKAQCGPDATAEDAAAKTKSTAAPADDAAKGLTSKQCGAKYQAAKEAGTLGDMKWNDFRKAECGPGASAGTESTKAKAKKAAAGDDAAKGLTSKQCGAKYQAAKEAGTLGDMKWNDFRKAECGPGASAGIETTTAKTKKAAASQDETAKGLTSQQCSAKYQAAKAADALNGMKWNDYRKAECGPGASAAFEAPKATKASTSSGGGLSMKDCSAKYQSAKESGSLGGLKWNDFRKAKCGAGAADDETVPAESEANYTNEPETPAIAAPSGVKFPRAVSSKYSSEPEGKARMHTCLQQYYANKDNNALGGLKWIQKGGGYYSLCNARLKSGTS